MHRRSAPALAVALVVVAVLPAALWWGAGPSSAQLAPVTPAEAKARRDAAVAARDQAQRDLAERTRQREQLDGDLAGLDDDARSATTDLAAARRRADDAIATAYIGGGPVPLSRALLDAGGPAELEFRAYLVRDQAARLRTAVSDARRREEQAGAQVAGLAQALADADRALAEARQALFAADLAVARAERELRIAEFADALRDPGGRSGRPAGSDLSPPPDQTGNAWGPGWDALRRCESGGDYNAVSSQGTYRGAYQFDLQTWAGVGGTGDPIDNTTAEQDYRAQILYNQRGSQPWPICGRYLDLWNDFLRELGLGGNPTTPPVPPPRPTPNPLPPIEVTVPPSIPVVPSIPVPPPPPPPTTATTSTSTTSTSTTTTSTTAPPP